MLMIDNLKNYLYDKNYFINIYDNYIHIFNYIDLKEFKDDVIILQMSDFKLIIKGKLKVLIHTERAKIFKLLFLK